MKKIALALVILLSFSFSGIKISAEQFYTLESNSQATVVQIVDGDAFIATLIPSGKPVLVRMLGVDAEGYDPSIKYLNTAILGSNVRLIKDSRYPNPSGRWNFAYVYKGDLLINADILRTGNAKLNTYHEDITLYTTLKQEESAANSKRIGIWGVNSLTVYSDYLYASNGININTATAEQLSERLRIGLAVAEDIVYYRSTNPFNNIREIKFVEDFTKEMFEYNREQMVVSTNINTATEDDLMTLINLSETDVENILDYRSWNSFSTIEDLHNKSVITSSKYSRNKLYISTEPVFEIDAVTPSAIANINTANLSQLKSAGLTETQAQRIIDYRSGYSYKTLGEINQLFTLTVTKLNSLEDNLHLFTDINKASRQELESLLGNSATTELLNKIDQARPFSVIDGLRSLLDASVYDSIAPYIYINSIGTDYINVNTASRSDLQGLGLSYDDASKVLAAQPNMKTSKRLPQALNDFKDSISLYTNINTASKKELLSLGTSMTDDIVSEIIEYRESQPFGDTDEVYQFFSSISESDVYSDIRNFLVVR